MRIQRTVDLKMADNVTVLNYAMTCEGCAKVAIALLSKQEGVTKVQTDVAAKTVTVTGSADPQALVATLSKTGKAVSLKQ